jgi:hypothetical protein
MLASGTSEVKENKELDVRVEQIAGLRGRHVALQLVRWGFVDARASGNITAEFGYAEELPWALS